MVARRVLQALRVASIVASLLAGTALAQDTSSSSQPLESTDGSSSAESALAQDSGTVPTSEITNPETPVKKVGTPFPLHMDPGGYRIGPVHAINVTSSGFYDVATPVGQGSHQYWGTSVGTELVYTHPVNNGLFAIQGSPVISVTNGSAYFNSVSSIDFNKQLTPRWNLSASDSMTFYQNNYLLQNPQYLLAYSAGGIVLQTLYAQSRGSSFYQSTGVALNYQMSGRTQISFSPDANLSFAAVNGTTYLVSQLGAGATVTHLFTPNRSGFVYGNLVHAFSSQAQTTDRNSWGTLSMGAGFSQKIGRSWNIAASVGASLQPGMGSGWVPTGNLSIMRAFHNGTVAAAYSRTTAAQTLLSTGYFDQVDLSYVTSIGRKVSASVGLGAFRSIQTSSHDQGRRVYASLSYRWLRNMSWSAGYSHMNQNSTPVNFLFDGKTSQFTIGLNWTLGQPSHQ